MKCLPLAIVFAILAGCAGDTNPGRQEKVNVGMTEAEVVSAIGEPDMKHELDDSVPEDTGWTYKSKESELWVDFKEGKVMSFRIAK